MQLEFKFGELGTRERQLLQTANIPELERIGEQLMRAQSLAAIFSSAAPSS